MCWEMDYKFYVEQNKASEARSEHHRRAIDKLLNEATEKAQETNVEPTPVTEVVPAK